MEIETIDINILKEYKSNAKIHTSEQIEQIKESIKIFGNNDPIAIDENNIIIEGHGRLMALKELGYKECPIIRLTHLNEEEKKAYTLVHNKLTLNTDFEMDILKDELNNIFNIDMGDFGFDFKNIIIDFEEETKEVEIPKVEEKVISKYGEIYKLGEHKIICGDSTDNSIIDSLMDGVKADLVFTDPPYGMKKEKDGVINDNLNYEDLLDFNKKWIPISFKYLKSNGSWYCWGIDEPLMDIYSEIIKPMIKKQEVTFRNLITWNKGNGQGQNSEITRMYATADEKCLFVMSGVQGFNNNSDNYYDGFEQIRQYLLEEWYKISDKKDWDKHLGNFMGKHYFTKSQWSLPTKEAYEKLQEIGKSKNAFKKEYNAFEKEYSLIKKDYEEIKKDYYSTRAYFNNTHDNMNNVWYFNRTSNQERENTGGHATPKPIELCARAIKSSSRKGDLVLDLFGGSGSTLISCEQLGRKCNMVEYDPRYVDVIIKRWELETGKKAEKIK